LTDTEQRFHTPGPYKLDPKRQYVSKAFNAPTNKIIASTVAMIYLKPMSPVFGRYITCWHPHGAFTFCAAAFTGTYCTFLLLILDLKLSIRLSVADSVNSNMGCHPLLLASQLLK
jgi:hypothetical protein